MSRLRFHRRPGRLPAFLALAGILSVFGGLSANALEGESFSFGENRPGGGRYGPIIVSDPVSVTVDGELITPDECRVMASCLTIPFDIEVPSGLKTADDYYANIAVGWEDPEHLSDVDVFVWDDGQEAANKRAAEGDEPSESKSYTVQTDSASSANPEIPRLFKPDLGRYNLVIFNFAGPPVEVDIVGELIVARFSSPFELLAPDAKPPAAPPKRAAITPTTQASTPAAAPEVAAPAPAAAPVLAELDVQLDGDFDDFGDADFEDSLLPELTMEDQLALAALSEQLAANSNQPPSTATLLLSLVLGPVLLLSAAGTWLWRRSPAAIDIG